MSISITLQQMGVICILVIIGFYLYKRHVIDDTNSQKLSTIVVDICTPALIMASILSGNITASRSDLITAIILGAVFYVVLIILGFVLPLILKIERDKRKFYNLMTVYTNTGFLGIPIARAILPANAILYIVVINVFYNLAFFTHGMALLNSGKDNKTGHSKHPILSILNPGTVMALLSLVVFWYDITLPPIIANTVEYVGNATVFLSMTLLGVSIARSSFFKSFKDIKIWIYIVLRMIVVPFAVFFVMKLIGFDPVAILAICLMAAVPAGSLPLITADKLGLDTELLSSSIAMTTFISIFTITIIMSVLSGLV